MENSNKRYWKGIEELKNETSFVKNIHNEFGNMPSEDDSKGNSIVDGVGTHRRDFLKMLGFGVAAVSLAACEAPVKNAIPYINKPLDVDPTIANWYASTFVDGGEYASILVKTREGRPIKIEGNKLSPITQGGISARAQASVLSLYDNEKLKGPRALGKSTDWKNLDQEIIAKLDSIASKGGEIRIVSNTILSPTTKKAISEFTTKYSAKHISYDANSAYGLSLAHGGSLPELNFSKANTIVSIGADFLGTWIAPTEFARQWAETRKVSSSHEGKKTMSRHYQFETILSNTGANADYRTTYKPSQEGLVVAALYNEIAKLTGASSIDTASLKIDHLAEAAKDLVASKGASIVVSGSNDPSIQQLVIAINQLVGAYGTTINTGVNVHYRQGNDAEMNGFIKDLKAGKIAAVIFYNANPVYNHPMGSVIAEGLKKLELSVATNERADETASLCNYIAPDSHFLESWNDAEPKSGYYSLTQPAISTIFKTRQAQSSFLIWAGKEGDYAKYLKNNWQSTIAKVDNVGWNSILHDGIYGTNSTISSSSPSVNLAEIASLIAANYQVGNQSLEISVYEKVGLGTGSQANNPWLQEFPEPVSKACWDNYASVSQITAGELDLKQGDIVKVSGNGYSVELPVLVQPGQANNTIAIAIGYGRTKAGKSADGVGVNAYPFLSEINGACVGACTKGVSLEKTGEEKEIAQTQTHHTVMAREAVIQETVLAEFVKNPQSGRYKPEISTAEGKKKATDISLWNGHEYNNHHWGMVIDLNSCTGCSACVVACSAENNVPVVGRQEVINRREMHWMRIDRYYSSDAEVEDLKGLEVASNNPEVVFQPMLCQHCDNAPCETVCPVLATTHSTEGLNQMTYNRCIGTRYCANNCPYKVRRFNWFRYYQTDEFDFHFNNDLGRMVLNPDVTVRSRGVMEKCSMCVQRIQEGKLNAKKEKRRPMDGEIQVACAQTCPTNAITFGDKNDPNSAISKLLAEEYEGRAYGVIEEINVAPNIAYLSKIRNKNNK